MVQGEPPRRRTQAERRATTRTALVQSARALFAEHGYVNAGREEIVEQAGVTRGAMYYHFRSKEELFRAVYEAVETDLNHAIAKAAMSGSADPVERLRRGALALLEAAATPEVRRIVLLDAPSVLPFAVRRELADRYGLGLLREALAAVEAAGRLRLGPIEPLAHVLLAALHEAATVVAEGGDGPDKAAMSNVVEGLLGLLCG